MHPYAAPKSSLEEFIPGSSGTAALIGAAIGNGISYAVLYVITIIFLWVLTWQGVSVQDLQVKLYQSMAFLVVAHSVGFLCLIPGGYWSARLRPQKPMATALLAGGIVAMFTAITNILPYEDTTPVWSRIVSVVSIFPAFAFGAALWQRSNGDE